MDVFFDTLSATDSREKAFETLKKTLLRRKLDLAGEECEVDLDVSFKELWDLYQKEKALGKLYE